MHGQIKPFTLCRPVGPRPAPIPFNLGAKWVGRRTEIPGATQLDFVSTNDIIGGNSGSPVLNKDGRVIGLAFDGNIHSTGGAYGFDPALNRNASRSPASWILQALRKIYGANALADELQK